jgi:hypothetical protein
MQDGSVSFGQAHVQQPAIFYSGLEMKAAASEIET